MKDTNIYFELKIYNKKNKLVHKSVYVEYSRYLWVCNIMTYIFRQPKYRHVYKMLYEEELYKKSSKN